MASAAAFMPAAHAAVTTRARALQLNLGAGPFSTAEEAAKAAWLARLDTPVWGRVANCAAPREDSATGYAAPAGVSAQRQFILERDDGKASLKFDLAGGHVTSWVCGGEEQLFMSKKAVFVAGETARRGGISICWPAFDERNPPAGKHGFVRTSDRWLVESFGFAPPVEKSSSGVVLSWWLARFGPANTVGAGGVPQDPYVVLRHPTIHLEVDDATSAITSFHFGSAPKDVPTDYH